MTKRILLLSLGIVSILLYIFAPTGHSMTYVIYCTVIFVASSMLMLYVNCRQTFLKFELFFLIAYFFTNYVYPLVFYPINPYFSLFRLPFNEEYITRGTALATVAASWFNLGILESQSIKIQYKESFNITNRLRIPRILTIVLFLLFIPDLYGIYQTHIYSTEFEGSYVNVILKYVILYSVFAFLYDNRYSNLSFFVRKAFTSPVIIFTVIYTVLFLMIGSRTIPLNIVLFSLLLINILIYRISKKQVVLLIVGGALLLTAVGLARGGSGIEGGAITSIWDMGTDLTINNRSLYVLMEEVDEHGITYGKTMMMNVLSAIPFAQSLYLYLTGLPLSTISSASLVTELHFGSGYNSERIGLGTNLVGDVYLAFGIIGVIIMFWLFGYVLRKLYFNISKGKALSLLVYALFFMSSIYYSRSGYLTPARDVIWVLGAFWLSNLRLKKT